jgi:hypothetical protein
LLKRWKMNSQGYFLSLMPLLMNTVGSVHEA